MTNEEEYEQFVGPVDDEDDEICRRCNDWPCACLADQIALDDEWQDVLAEALSMPDDETLRIASAPKTDPPE